MISLTNTSSSTTQKLQAFLAGAAVTTNPAVTVVSHLIPPQTVVGSVQDKDRPYPQFTTLAGATETDIADAPPAGYIKVIDTINVYNADTTTVSLTICTDDNGTNRILWKRQLTSGRSFYWSEKSGPQVI